MQWTGLNVFSVERFTVMKAYKLTHWTMSLNKVSSESGQVKRAFAVHGGDFPETVFSCA